MNTIDQDAFGVLVERHRRELQAHCYRLMGSVDEAADMVQETFLKAWRGRDSLADLSSLRPWLYKIATNVCLDTLKRRPRRFVPRTRTESSTLAEPIPAEVKEPIWLEPFPDDLLLADDYNPEERVSARDDITMAFITALHLLPPRQRAVLILRDVMDWQASEVAALLNTTVASVKSALHRARSTLATRDDSPESVNERALDTVMQLQLDGYVRAWEAADANALMNLLKEDITFSMPPIPSWYRGKEIVRDLVLKTVFSGQAQGRWKLIPTRANRQPAYGLYRYTDAPGVYDAYGIQLLTFQGQLIIDITTFRNPDLFPHFKLPLTIGRT